MILGGGFIGMPLMRRLNLLGYKVVVFSRNEPSATPPQGVQWIRADFSNYQSVTSALKGVDLVYHLVASTVPRDEGYDVSREFSENVICANNLIKACELNNVRKIVFASSASVYGIQTNMPIDEKAQTNPISMHGIHKLTVEKFLLRARHVSGLDVRIARISNPYGPGQNLFGRQGFISIVIGNILKSLPTRLTNDGSMIRDFVYIDDIVTGLINIGIYKSVPPILNLGGGKAYTLLSVKNAIEDALRIKLSTETVVSTPADIPESLLDINLAALYINYIPKISLEEGLRYTLRAAKLLK